MVSLLEDAQDLPNSNENTGATQQAHMPFCCRSLFGCDVMWCSSCVVERVRVSDYSHVAVCHTSHEAGITPLSEMRNAFCGSVVGHHPQQLSHTVQKNKGISIEGFLSSRLEVALPNSNENTGAI